LFASFALAPPSHKKYSIKVFKLLGGHSGVDINKNRANSIKMITRIFNYLSSSPGDWFHLINIISRSKSNAIPREAIMEISMDPKDENKLHLLVKTIMKQIKDEYKTPEPLMTFEINRLNEKIERVLSKKSEIQIKNVLQTYPNSVLAMEPDLPGMVKTSANLASVELKEGRWLITSSIRSSSESDMDNTISTIQNLLRLVQGETKVYNRYPSWSPNLQSNLLNFAKESFKEVMGGNPPLTALHAGLEPGVIESKYPGLEMMSIGPWLERLHSPDERILSASVSNSYEIVFKTVEKLSKMN
jgi:dipeptidase D